MGTVLLAGLPRLEQVWHGHNLPKEPSPWQAAKRTVPVARPWHPWQMIASVVGITYN